MRFFFKADLFLSHKGQDLDVLMHENFTLIFVKRYLPKYHKIVLETNFGQFITENTISNLFLRKQPTIVIHQGIRIPVERIDRHRGSSNKLLVSLESWYLSNLDTKHFCSSTCYNQTYPEGRRHTNTNRKILNLWDLSCGFQSKRFVHCACSFKKNILRVIVDTKEPKSMNEHNNPCS